MTIVENKDCLGGQFVTRILEITIFMALAPVRKNAEDYTCQNIFD